MDSNRGAITDRLQRWTAAFNARDAVGVCDVFAPDLVSTVPEALDGSRDALCAPLDAPLAQPGLQLHYDNPDIREIIVSGALREAHRLPAVAALTMQMKVTRERLPAEGASGSASPIGQDLDDDGS